MELSVVFADDVVLSQYVDEECAFELLSDGVAGLG
jgi:hypothetical protein